MYRKFAVALLFLLSALLIVENYSFAQNRQDYIITHEPSVNVRPCPRFTEECNAIYRLPAGTIIKDALVVSGDWYGTSDEWIRFWRETRYVYIHSDLVSVYCGSLRLTGTIDNNIRQLERWLMCEFDISVETLPGLGEDDLRQIWLQYIEAACGKNASSYFWWLDENLSCQRISKYTGRILPAFTPIGAPTQTPRPTWTPRPTQTPSPTHFSSLSINRQCEHITFPTNGTVESRRNIFERWLDCQHDLTRRTFENLNDEVRMFDIWWEFVDFACGNAIYPEYWIIDPDWRCKQFTYDRDALNEPPCGPVRLTGSIDDRERNYWRWLKCNFGFDSNQYIELEVMATLILFSIIPAACGEDSYDYYWSISEDFLCERRSVYTYEILPTFTPTEAPTRTPSPTRTLRPTSTPRSTRNPSPTPTCGPGPFTGSVINRMAVFERWLKCEYDLGYNEFWDLPDDRWADIWWQFVELACGADTADYLWDIDYVSWECERIPPGGISKCEPDELTGTRINRKLIFEQWLTCEYGIDYMTFLGTLDEFRQEYILRKFIWLACGEDTDDYYWYLDDDWVCQKDDSGEGRSA